MAMLHLSCMMTLLLLLLVVHLQPCSARGPGKGKRGKKGKGKLAGKPCPDGVAVGDACRPSKEGRPDVECKEGGTAPDTYTYCDIVGCGTAPERCCAGGLLVDTTTTPPQRLVDPTTNEPLKPATCNGANESCEEGFCV